MGILTYICLSLRFDRLVVICDNTHLYLPVAGVFQALTPFNITIWYHFLILAIKYISTCIVFIIYFYLHQVDLVSHNTHR